MRTEDLREGIQNGSWKKIEQTKEKVAPYEHVSPGQSKTEYK
jgi:hypothetical protein